MYLRHDFFPEADINGAGVLGVGSDRGFGFGVIRRNDQIDTWNCHENSQVVEQMMGCKIIK